MACPTCDKTMQKVCDGHFWCPCCGTLRSITGYLGKEYTNDSRPSLVDRTRAFVRMIDGTAMGRYLKQQAEECGVLEAIELPGDR